MASGRAAGYTKRLRHSFGVHAITREVPLNMRQKWLGHAMMETTTFYADAVGEEQQTIAAKMRDKTMNEALQFWRDLGAYLEIYMDVLDTIGADVNAGEEFTARFRITNRAPSPKARIPLIRFKNPTLIVRRTPYAAPVVGGKTVGKVKLTLPDALLAPGERSFVSQKMQALASFDDGDLQLEPVAVAVVVAALDSEAFFRILKKDIEKAAIHH